MLKKLLFPFIGVLLILSLFALHFIISFSFGGYTGLISQFQSLPNDAKLGKLRSDALEHLSYEHMQLSSLDGFTLYEKTYSDMCAKGEHDWKRSDSFSNICAYRVAQYYGVSEHYDSFLLKLERLLNDLGWKLQNQNPPQKTISEIVNDNPQNIFKAEYPIYVKRGADKNIMMNLRINNFPGYYSGWERLEQEPKPFGFSVSGYQILYQNQSQVSPEDIFQEISTSGMQKLIIVVTETYFKN